MAKSTASGKAVTIGLDIAKDVFQVHAVDKKGATILRRRLRRSEVMDFFRTQKHCLVGMEATGTSHHWARALNALGHRAKIMPARYVKAYVKLQKNDRADAEAICEAVSKPTMRFVPVKSEQQQAALMLIRARDVLVRHQRSLLTALRGFLAEFGIVENAGSAGAKLLLKQIADHQKLKLCPAARTVMEALAAQISASNEKALALEKEIRSQHAASPASQRLSGIPGIGFLTASALVATIPDPRVFRSGRKWLPG
jgi:transposase